MPDYHQPLIPGYTYHIFSRATGNEKLFKEEKNYSFFLTKFIQHIMPVADVYAFCLLPNHFHFLIKIKSAEDIKNYYLLVKKEKKFTEDILPDFIMERFSNLLNSYTKSFNKIYNRKGSLFIDYLKRTGVTTDAQFGATIFYIHKNPVHHGYCSSIGEWKWSSYKSLLSTQYTNLLRNEVIDYFGSKEQFISFHQQPVYLKNAVVIEE